MRIKKLSAANFAGSTFVHNLNPMTVFVGPNMRGKTSRLFAVIWALSKKVPGVANKPSDIYAELATGETMSTKIITDNEWSIIRSLTMRRGSVKESNEFTGFPDGFAWPPVAGDIDEFIGLSDREYTRFLFKNAAVSITPEAVADSLQANLKGIKVEDGQEQAESVIRELAESISKVFEDARRQDLTVAEIVEQVFGSLAESKSAADANVKRMQTTHAGVTQVAVDAAPPAPDCEARLVDARAKLAAAQTECGVRSQARREVESKLTAARTKAATTVDQTGLLAEIERLTGERDSFASVSEPPVFNQLKAIPTDDEKDTLDTLSERKRELFMATQEPETDLTELKCRMEVNRRARDEAVQRDRELLNEVGRLRRELEATESETCCSKCGQSIVELRKKVLDDMRVKIQGLEAKMASTSAVAAVASGNYEDAARAVNQAEEKNRLIRKNAETYREIDKQHREAREQVVNRARMEHDRKVGDFVRAQQAVTARNQSIAGLRSRLEDKGAAAAAESIPGLETAQTKSTNDWVAAQDAVTTMQKSILSLEGDVRRLHASRAEAQQRARIATETQGFKVRAEVLKHAVGLVDALKSELVKRAVEPLVAQMNVICGDAFGRPLVFRDGRIGFENANGGVIEKSMSGMERSLACCAMSVVLAKESPLKLLILDEMGKLDVEVKRGFVSNLLTLVATGELDQVLLADVSDLDYGQFMGEKNFGVEKL